MKILINNEYIKVSKDTTDLLKKKHANIRLDRDVLILDNKFESKKCEVIIDILKSECSVYKERNEEFLNTSLVETSRDDYEMLVALINNVIETYEKNKLAYGNYNRIIMNGVSYLKSFRKLIALMNANTKHGLPKMENKKREEVTFVSVKKSENIDNAKLVLYGESKIHKQITVINDFMKFELTELTSDLVRENALSNVEGNILNLNEYNPEDKTKLLMEILKYEAMFFNDSMHQLIIDTDNLDFEIRYNEIYRDIELITSFYCSRNTKVNYNHYNTRIPKLIIDLKMLSVDYFIDNERKVKI